MKRGFVVFAVIGLLMTLALATPGVAQDQIVPPQIGLRPNAPTYALHGQYWVGTREFVIEPDSQRPLPLTIWYPALNPDGKSEDVTYTAEYPPVVPTLSVQGHALLNASPDAESGPLSAGDILARGMDNSV